MRRLAVLVVGLAMACSAERSPDVIATTDQIELSTSEVVRRAVTSQPGGPDGASLQVEALRQAARAIAVERIIAATIDDRAEMEARYAPELESLRRDVVVNDFVTRDVLPGIEVAPTEVEEFIDRHQGALEVEGMRRVSHLFRLYTEEEPRDATFDLLRSLARRAREGEPFGVLAEQYSQSETRSNRGNLGWIVKGRLAPAVEDAVFSLGVGEVSDPVDLGSGAAIFWVAEAIDGKVFRREDVRPLVRRTLTVRKVNQELRRRLADIEPDEAWLVIDDGDVRSALASRPDADPAIRIADFEMTFGEVRELARERRATDLRLGEFDLSSADVYEEIVLRQLAYLDLQDTGYLQSEDDGGTSKASLEELETALLVQKRTEELIRDRVRADDQELRRFYRETGYLYQTPLQFDLRMLSAPIRRPVADQMKAFESAVQRLASGEGSLDEAAEQLRAEVVEIKGVTVGKLSALDPKIPRLVLEAGGAGVTIPFQLGHRLNIIEVAERREPRQLEFEAVVDRVVDDYIQRHQQAIYAEMSDELLRRAGFTFFEDVASNLVGNRGVEAQPPAM